MAARRATGLPLEQVVGWAQFYGLRILLDPDVFVPRRRTEFLVSMAVSFARAYDRQVVVVDLCCGSGALGLAVAATLQTVELHAADIDAAAVRCARRNLAGIGAVHQGDLFDALPATLHRRVDVLLANVPYVPSEAITLLPAEARDHEPRTALDGGADGQEVMRRVIGASPRWLRPGGHLLIEATDAQSAAALDCVARAGMAPRLAVAQEFEATVVIGRAIPHADSDRVH